MAKPPLITAGSRLNAWLDDNYASWFFTAQGNLYSMYALTKARGPPSQARS